MRRARVEKPNHRPSGCRRLSGIALFSSSDRSEEHTSELQSLMRISYAVFCLKKKNKQTRNSYIEQQKNKKTKKPKPRGKLKQTTDNNKHNTYKKTTTIITHKVPS